MLELVKELCAIPGVASFEDEVRSSIKARVAPYADEVRVDSMGNLIVFKKGRKSTGHKLALSAHMDEVGLIIKAITDEGYLKFSCVGRVDRRVLIGKPIRVGANAIPGVIGLKAYHLVSPGEEKVVPKLDDFYIDIGARSREEAEEMVSLGDCGVFVSDSMEFGSGLLKAKALGDRIGCAVLMKLLEEDLPLDCTFVFTVQEEVGHRGAFGAAFALKPEIVLVLDAIAAADLPGIEAHKQVCALGKGPVIPFMDEGSIADRGLFDLLRQLAEEHQIPWQTSHYVSTGNEATAFQLSREGVRTATLAAAVRYLRAPSGIASVEDLGHILNLTRLFLDAVAERV